MRILVATHNYPRFAGDHAGSFIARLCEGLAARGHELLVVAPHAPGLAREEHVAGVAIRRFRYGPDTIERVAYRGDLHRRQAFDPSALLGIPAMLAAYGAALRRERRRFRPDVVHAHWWFPGGTLASTTRVPTVVTCHGSDVRLLDRGGVLRMLGRRTLTRATAVTCASRFLARDVERLVPTLAGRVDTTYMPVDPHPFESTRQGRGAVPVVLFVGNLVPSKGTAVLVDAFALVRARGVAAQLRIVGAGTEEASLRAQAARLGIASEVAWAGIVPHDRIAEEYARASIVVLPSRGQAEGLGLVLAEALLSGAAVVATAAGGIPEVVRDEETGLIARDGDAAHLAAQLGRLLDDPALRHRLVAAGAAHVRARFSPEATTNAMERVYHRIASPSAT